MSIDSMKEHYQNAGRNYEAANNSHSNSAKSAYQEEGDREYGKAEQEAENTKRDINTQACKEAGGYYDKSAEAYEKGDMKAAKEYQEKGDKVMSDAKEKEKEVDREKEKAASEARSKMEGLEKTRY